MSRPRAEAVVDVAAIRENVAALRAHVGGRDLMAVVKADGYGHGLVESARASREGGATWLGVALLDEALALRAAGDSGPILSWLAVPGERYAAAIEAAVDVAAYTVDQLDEISAAASVAGRPAMVQLKVDTGLGRGGGSLRSWPDIVRHAGELERAGRIRVSGIWSHLAAGDEPGHPANKAQVVAFADALDVGRAAGLDPQHVHLANSGATLTASETWHTMVRPGISVYGLSPLAGGASPVPLRPAMTLVAALALVKTLPAGHGVSYGHTFVTDHETTVGLVPLGYGDGVPRHASNVADVAIDGVRLPIIGRICMDQFVVDLGAVMPLVGDAVVVFGEGHDGSPTADDWARAAQTISYEIVTRIGPRVPRRHVDTGTA